MTSDTLPPKAILGFRCKTKLDVDMVEAAMAAASNIDHQITREQCDTIIRAAIGVLAKASQTSPYSIQKLAWFSSTAGTPFVIGEPLTLEELAAAFHKAKASVINPHNQFAKEDSNRRNMTDITHGWHNAKPKQLYEGGCVVTEEMAAKMLGDKK